MRTAVALLMLLMTSQVWAQACVIESTSETNPIKLCQQNRSIPESLFREGFCAPQLKGQSVSVSFFAQCPQGAFGECRGAQAKGMPYQQDIFYYGIASDARYLKPACEQHSQGQWLSY